MSITKETRRESYVKTEKENLKAKIISILKQHKTSLSASEIADLMYSEKHIAYPMRQAVAPRLTELVADGLLKVDGKAYDMVTQRKVATYKLVER